MNAIEGMIIAGCAPNAVLDDARQVTLETVEVPVGVAVISNGAFSLGSFKTSNLKKVVLPEGVKEIRECAFYYCADLSQAVLPASLEVIGESAFSGCGFTDLVIPRGVKRIEKRAYAFCKKLVNVELPDTLEFLGEGAFLEDFRLKRVYIPASVKVIEADAFAKACQVFNNDQMEIFCEGEVPDGWVDIDEIRDVEHTVTDYDSPRNFHTSSGSFDFHRYTTKERVIISWNPDKYKVHTNVSRERFREICKAE